MLFTNRPMYRTPEPHFVFKWSEQMQGEICTGTV